MDSLVSAFNLKENSPNCSNYIYYHHYHKITVSVLSEDLNNKSNRCAKIVAKASCDIMPGLLAGLQFNNKSLLYIQANEFKENIYRFIKTSLKELGLNDRCHCTLGFALYAQNCDRWLIGHIGEGLIAAIGCDDKEYIISNHLNNNYTTLITDTNANKKIDLYNVKGIKGVVLSNKKDADFIYKNGKLNPDISNFFMWQENYGEEEAKRIFEEKINKIYKNSNKNCSLLFHQKIQHLNSRKPKITKI